MPSFLSLLEHVENGRYENQGYQGGYTQAGNHGNGQGVPELSTLSTGKCHWHHAKDGGQGSHHDGSETVRASLCHRIRQGFSALEEQMGIVQVHDCVLDRKSTRLNSSHLKLSRMPSSA